MSHATLPSGPAKGEGCAHDSASEIEWEETSVYPSLDRSALYGLAGDFVNTVAPHSEADLSALLAQFLCAFGCAVGPGPHFMVEATRHTARLMVLLIGRTAGGRKGTALDQVKRVLGLADSRWLAGALQSGLASGEGLIERLRDRDKSEPVEKRILVVEAEFARVLATASREGSILSAVIRDAWDSGHLQQLTRKNPIVAGNCHVGMIGHITSEEARAKITSPEIGNGFLNRYLIICSSRRQRLPNGGALRDDDLAGVANQLRAVIDRGRLSGRLTRSFAAEELWAAFYNTVPDSEGLLGAVTARAEAQVLRLSMIYALLDRSSVIEVEHLRAALALWQYAFDSAQYVFGKTLGDDVADQLLVELRAVFPDGLDREAQRALFCRHKSAARLEMARKSLLERGLIRVVATRTDGRPREVAYAVHRAKSAESAKSPSNEDAEKSVV